MHYMRYTTESWQSRRKFHEKAFPLITRQRNNHRVGAFQTTRETRAHLTNTRIRVRSQFCFCAKVPFSKLGIYADVYTVTPVR